MGRSHIFTIDCTVLLQEKNNQDIIQRAPLWLIFGMVLQGFICSWEVFLFVFLFVDTNNFVLRLLKKKIFRSVCSEKVNKLISFLWIRKWSKLYVKSSSSREIPCGSVLLSWCLGLYAQQYRKTKFHWICFI